MVGWCHQLNGHEFEHALGVGDGQESVTRELDMTKQMNCTELKLDECFQHTEKYSK